MSDHNDNDENYFFDDVLNADDDDDQDDVDVPYGIDYDDDDNVNVHDDDTCHNTSRYCKNWDIVFNKK